MVLKRIFVCCKFWVRPSISGFNYEIPSTEVSKSVHSDTAPMVYVVYRGFSNILDYSYKIITKYTNLNRQPTQIGFHGRKNVPEICKNTKCKRFLEMTNSPAEVHFGYQIFLQLLKYCWYQSYYILLGLYNKQKYIYFFFIFREV